MSLHLSLIVAYHITSISSNCTWTVLNATLDLTPLQDVVIDSWDWNYYEYKYSICGNNVGCSGESFMVTQSYHGVDRSFCLNIAKWDQNAEPNFDPQHDGTWNFSYSSWCPTFICAPNIEYNASSVYLSSGYTKCPYQISIYTKYACLNWYTPSPTTATLTAFAEISLIVEIVVPILCCLVYIIGGIWCYRNNLKYSKKNRNAYHSINHVDDGQSEQLPNSLTRKYQTLFSGTATSTLFHSSDHKVNQGRNNNYKAWNHADILQWILELQNGYFMKYRNKLAKALKEENVQGYHLKDVEFRDIKGWGITDFVDKKLLADYIEEMVNSDKRLRDLTEEGGGDDNNAYNEIEGPLIT